MNDSVSKPRVRIQAGSFRGRKTVRQMYKSALPSRHATSWGSTPVHIDHIVRRHQKALVARSREQRANNDYMKSFVSQCHQNIVGSSGIMLQAQAKLANGKLDTFANDAIEASWKDWGKKINCDIAGKRSWKSYKKAIVNSVAIDGEYMIRLCFGKGEYGIQLQLLDPQMCPVDFDEERRDGTFVKHGIHFDEFGKPLGYFFTTLKNGKADYTYGGRAFVYVKADEIIHGFIEEYTGQKRGFPWAATSLYRMRQHSDYEDAALINAKIGASKMAFLKPSLDAYDSFKDEEMEDFEVESSPGSMHMLPPGVDVEGWDTKYPTAEFAPFNKAMLRGMATGLGLAYNNFANDLEGVNLSSIRHGMQSERDMWKELQEFIIEHACQDVFDNWLRVSLLKGQIKKPSGTPLKAQNYARLTDVMWQPRRWPFIDPVKDMQAAKLALEMGITSPSQIIREQGRDPQQTWRQIADDIRQMTDAGIPTEIIAQVFASKVTGVSQNDGPDNQVESNASNAQS